MAKRTVDTTAGRDSYAAFMRRAVRALRRRAEGGDLDGLVALLALQDQVAEEIRRAGHALHSNGVRPYSWAEIAAVTGTSRQAAALRFTLPPETAAREDQSA